jgi:predicted AlkP superfamily phosphohydrolase/phosphomutase
VLLIVGLDGASLDLAHTWAESGDLPHLRRLFSTGAWGPLRSTMPAATFPAWTTFMTGVNPGRHGIFDFTRRIPGDYAVQFVNGSYRKAPTIWNTLSQAGKRIGVFGVPGTYPPEPVNGYMISGFDTPVTLAADASFVYPPELAVEVEANGGFPFADFQEFRVDHEWHRSAIRKLRAGIATKTRFVARRLRQERLDCAMVLFGESDTVAHHFWRFHDPGSPRYTAQGALEFGDAIRQIYRDLDEAIGVLVDAADPDAVLVCSDHGSGGAGDIVVHLNLELERAGLLRWHHNGRAARAAAAAKRGLLRWLPARVQARCFRLASGRFADALESAARFADIDWKRTRAFSEELNYFPSVWLNVSGRDPAGIVEPAEYDRVAREVTDTLLALRHPQGGERVVERVWRRDELYDGPWVTEAPDLILEFAAHDGYSYTCLPSRVSPLSPPVRPLKSDERGGGKLSGMSGSHRRQGLFALSGPVLAGPTGEAGIADMAPTILALCGVPVPTGLDGRVLPCLNEPVAAGEPWASTAPCNSETAYTPEQERQIERRLQALGYIG